MKKILSALLVFTMVIATFAFTTSAAYSGTPAEKFWTGKQMTIEVDTAEKLVAVFAAMSNKAEFAKKTIKLTADIVLNDATLKDMQEGKKGLFNWADVVDFNFEFGGIFDGNGHICTSFSETCMHSKFFFYALIVGDCGNIVNSICITNAKIAPQLPFCTILTSYFWIKGRKAISSHFSIANLAQF